MSVTLTSPVEGRKVGETYSGKNEDWLVANGYAARAGDFDGLHATSVKADKDPTLAANREAPKDESGEDILAVKDLKLDDPRLEVAPQARLVPAGLEDTDPRVHGTRGIDGSGNGEDKLREKVNAQDRAEKPAQDEPLLQVAPQATIKTQAEVDKESDKAAKAAKQ